MEYEYSFTVTSAGQRGLLRHRRPEHAGGGSARGRGRGGAGLAHLPPQLPPVPGPDAGAGPARQGGQVRGQGQAAQHQRYLRLQG